MKIQQGKLEETLLLTIDGRVDSFTFDVFKQRLGAILKENPGSICLNIDSVDFLSLPTIKYIDGLAVKIKEDGGEMVIVGGNDKTRRHLEIYGDTDNFRLVREEEEVHGETKARPVSQPRFDEAL